MRSFFLLLLVLPLLMACNNNVSNTENNNTMNTTPEVPTAPTDEQTIQTLIHTLFSATDNRDWATVKGTMAASVYTDYSALGGEPGQYTPEEIVNDWEALLPGFERTIHLTANEAIWVAGDRATATLDGVATHYTPVEDGADFWTVIVGYDLEFVQEEGAWKLARIDVSLYDQLGNENLPAQAAEKVKQGDIQPIKESLASVDNFEAFDPVILLENWKGFAPNAYSVHRAGASKTGGVTVQEVEFNSNGANLKGHLFLPPHFEADQQYQAVIVTGSWTSVKEQMPDEYASLLAQAGYLSLTFDFTGFGASEGQPRQVEDYVLKIGDIKAAIDYLTTHPNVEAASLTGMGFCASSGYMAHAAAQDPRLKNLVLVAPWLHNPAIAQTIYDMRPGKTEGLLEAARQAKATYAETGEMAYVLAASELDPLSAMFVPNNVFDYYLNPAKAAGQHYDNRFAVSSWEPWLTFDGIASAQDIQQPVFIVHSEQGAVPQGTKDFYAQLNGPKDIVWLNDYNQQQLYFEAEAVNSAVEKVVDYLKAQ